MERKNRKMSDETKRKISQALMGVKNPRYGKPVTDQTREKISKAMKDYWSKIPQY